MTTFRLGDRELESQETFIAGGLRCGTAALNDFQKARIRSHLATSRAAGIDLVTGDF
jgi:hypothetical protein